LHQQENRATTEQDAIRKRRQEEIEKAVAEHNSGEDVVFPESFRKIWRTLLGPRKRR
jgi:hypothetical protein